jgi:RES domain-containing protein
VVSSRPEPARLRGTWTAYRQVAPGRPPFWHPVPSSVPPAQPSARWHDEWLGQLAQYLSLEADGAWAELVRYEDLRDDDDRRGLPRTLWQAWVSEHDVADLSTPERAAACGLDADVLVADDHEPCRALGSWLRERGFRGLLAPSAAAPGALNLTLFGGRRELLRRSRRAAAGNRRPDRFVLANAIAEEALTPAHVLGWARRYGEPPRRRPA